MKNLKAKTQKGFSLVELMVVIAIIAILAAVAIPMYSNYTTRAKIAKYIAESGTVKTQIAESLSDGKDIASETFDAPKGITVVSGSTTGGAINIDLNTLDATSFRSADDTIRLIASAANGSVSWTCAYNSNAPDLSASKVPTDCSTTF